MVPRLRRRQHPRRFSRLAADVLVLKAITSRSQASTITNGTPTPFLRERTTSTPEGLRDNKLQVARRRPLHQQRDNDLRLGRLDSSSDGLRVNATAERPSFMSHHGGREPAIKAKEPEVRSAGGVDGLVGGGNRFCKGKPHLWRPPPQHRRQRPPARQTPHRRTAAAPMRTGRSSLPSSPRLSQNTSTALAAYDVLCDPPVQPTAQGGPGRGRPAPGATDTRAADGQPRSAPVVGGGTGSSARAAQAGELDTRQLPAPRAANTLLPRSLREGAGRCPCGGGPRLGAPSPPAWMMNFLEAEGRGRPRPGSLFPTARPMVIILGDRRQGTVAGLHDEIP
jgi:hypothetical protein